MCSNYNLFDSDSDTNSIVDDSDTNSIVDDSDENSSLDSDSSNLLPIRKRVRRISSSDDDEEISTNISDDWVWENTDNKATIHCFSGLPGINPQVLARLENENASLDIVYEILSEDFWHMLATETNRYHQQIIEDEKYRCKKFDEKWENTNSDEMKAYYAFQQLKATGHNVVPLKHQYSEKQCHFQDLHYCLGTYILQIMMTQTERIDSIKYEV
ncbi:hypothetical protein BLOT_009984 [Blomia tropicalis]|nr:hypothetical protein BLOT_009984 [Blomia tropicalis]